MTRPPLHPTPHPRAVWLAQLRAVAFELRREAIVAAVLMALVTAAVLSEILRGDNVVDFRPHEWIVPGLLGLVLPISVWKGRERSGSGFLWTLPVERSRHALARVCAGWTWLMAAVAVFVLWLLGLTMLSGGSIVAEETVRILTSPPPAGGSLDPGALRTVQWTPDPVLWLAPFTAATATYLLASALAVGPRHPLRWIGGTLVGVFLLAGAADVLGNLAESEWLIFAPSRVITAIYYGRYGIETLLIGRTDLLSMSVTLSTGETVPAWRALPNVGHWATATLIWTGVGVLALLAAAARHRERRRT